MPGLSGILPALQRRTSSIRQRIRTISSSSSISQHPSTNEQPAAAAAEPTGHRPYSVYQQISSIIMSTPPAIAILDSAEITQKILEAILEGPNGRRGLSRLARTCRAWVDPALNVLWRELDSLVPLIGLFPNHLLKKTKKPGLGLATPPAEKDWDKILKYGARVQKITYDELTNNVSASIFPVFEDLRPRTYLLPNLQHLTWRVTSPENLDRASLFLSSDLQGLVLQLGHGKFSTLPAFLANLGSRIKLKSFSLTAVSAIPDAFTDLLLPQEGLERLSLVAPGALSANVGKWAAYLPRLKSLQLDLSNRSLIVVNGFFQELNSGASTPDSDLESHTDSGVFSADEVDFTEVRKSLLRLTSDPKGPTTVFPALGQLHLTGQASNIAAFLTHISSPLTQLELVIEDPPDAADWRDLSSTISERFGSSLVTLRVGATLSSKYGELVRSTSRANMAPAPSRLSLQHFSDLPLLRTFSIDLPESILFTARDIERLADIAPNLEEVRLCPLARFMPNHPPQLSLEDLAPLVLNCPRLTTLAVVITAKAGSADPLVSSNSLLHLHVGHSWVTDTLEVAILLSQFAPHLESIKWFTERNRPGFVEANARGWQKVFDILPHMQDLRLTERKRAEALARLPPRPPPPPPEKEVVIEYVEVVAPRPPVANKAIDATVRTSECEVQATPTMVEQFIQVVPSTSERETQASPPYMSIEVDATTPMAETAVDATAQPLDVVHASAAVQTGMVEPSEKAKQGPQLNCNGPASLTANLVSLSSVFALMSLVRTIVSYPLSLPMRILSAFFGVLRRKPHEDAGANANGNARGDVPLDTLNNVCS